MKKILVLLVAILMANIANAQWQQTSGPGGGPINCFAGSGNNIYAGTNGGIYLSTNNGANWTAINNVLTQKNILSLAISGNTIFSGSAYNYYSGTSGAIQVSYDNGNNWTPSNNGILPYSEIRAFAIKDSNVYACSSNSLYLSTNLGNSWNLLIVDTSYNFNDFQTIIIKDSSVFLASYNRLYKSTNNGATWSLINNGLLNIEVTSFAIKDSNIYAGTRDGIYMSANNGDSWTAMNNGFQTNDYYIYTLTVSGNSILASTQGGIYRSTDNANTWTLVNANLLYNNINTMYSNGNNIFAGSYNGVYLSTDNGNNWNMVNHGIANSFINNLTVNENKIYASTNKGLFVSNDNGNNWTDLYIMDHLYTIGVADSSIFVQHTYTEIHHPFNTYNTLYLSTDNGNSWTAQNFLFNCMYAFVKKGNNYYAATNNGVYQLIKNGNNWTAVNIGLLSVFVNSLIVNGNTIFAYSYNNGIFKTTNNGVSWTPVTIGNSNSEITSFAKNNNSIFAATSYNYINQTCEGIYRSNNNGNTWIAVNNGLPDSTSFNLYSINGKAIFASTNNALYLSNNNGDSWDSVSLGMLSNINISTIALNDSLIFAGTSRNYNSSGYGVWKRKLSDILLPDSANVISGQANVCKSLNTINYTVNPISYATSYIWTLPSGEIDTTITNSITISFDSTSSSGYIKAKGLNICGSGGEISKFINVYNSPDIPTIIGLSNLQPFTTSIYSVNEQMGKTYHWTVTNGNILNGLGTNFINVQWGNTGIGQLNIIVSDSSFPYCSSATTLNINIGNIGIETLEGNKVVNIFPNPAIGSINIETNYKTELNYEILNLLGKSIAFSSFNEKTNIDISYYPKGIYFIKIISDKQTLIKKFIKE